jgi:glycosyltransferase involved in cell wall biosynthesis
VSSPRKNNLLYLAGDDVRKGRVEPLLWMQSCGGFAQRGLSVELVSLEFTREDSFGSTAEIWEHVGLAPTFTVSLARTGLRRGQSARLFVAVGVARAAMRAVRLCFQSRRAQDSIVYSKSPWLLLPFLLLRSLRVLAASLVYETHTLPSPRVKMITRRVDLVVVNSALLQREIVRDGYVRKSARVAHLPLPPHAPVHSQDRGSARAELGLPKDVRIACYAGKMPRSQLEFMLDAATRIRERRADFVLLLVGGNPQVDAWLSAEIARRDLRNAVINTGFIEPRRVGAYISAADVLLFYMSRDVGHYRYCTPAKGMDYQASGRPIVAADFPLFGEVFGSPGDRAMLADRSSPAEFAETLMRALDPTAETMEMAERARDWVAERTWDKRAEGILEALSRVEREG